MARDATDDLSVESSGDDVTSMQETRLGSHFTTSLSPSLDMTPSKPQNIT